eukprot:g47602.t1
MSDYLCTVPIRHPARHSAATHGQKYWPLPRSPGIPDSGAILKAQPVHLVKRWQSTDALHVACQLPQTGWTKGNWHHCFLKGLLVGKGYVLQLAHGAYPEGVGDRGPKWRSRGASSELDSP